ncbi:zinc finger CCCH domain-containing protein 2-like [Salvia splendens]|nr:zinc finger CCCH domain-containing protein 2-like [Salvia splendens]
MGTIDIPPRRQHQLLLSRSPTAAAFSKFLPCNDADDSDDEPYASDHFRIYEFKVRKCSRSRSHDWTDCPFAHPGEKARRRDPRRFCYSGLVCPEYRKGHCGKGDACEFSHGVFECWLHPSRYRTEACKDGKACKRKVCFFAHSSRQLRLVPDPELAPDDKRKSSTHCCAYCHHDLKSSPTSTLMGHMAQNISPPMSPLYRGDIGNDMGFGSLDSYKDALAELMVSFEAMSPSEAVGRPQGGLPWLDVNFNVEEPQFVMSPSTSTPVSRGHSKFYSGESKFIQGEYSGRNLMNESRFNAGEGVSGGPDLGWVNDLLT